MAVEVSKRDLKDILPGSYSVTTYYCRRPFPAGLDTAIRRLSGDTVSMALGYGSVFSNVASADSIPDLFLIAPDIKNFHWRKAKPAGLPMVQFALNKYGPNFYQEQVDLSPDTQMVKYGVIGLGDFLVHAQGARPDSEITGRGKGRLYTAGRLQKAVLVPIITPENPNDKHAIDLAINQARIDGVWLSLGLLSDKFTFDDLAWTYVGLSYMADVRVEKKGKSQALLGNNKKEYEEMLTPILEEFVKSGILGVSSDDSDYQKYIAPSRQEVDGWLKECRKTAFLTNYLKNPLTFGLMEGMLYALAKVRRAQKG